MMGRIKRLIYSLRRPKQVPIIEFRDKDHLLEGKIALITGGGSGIGKAIARAYLNSGAKVIIAGTNKSKLESAKEELGEPYRVQTIVIDISSISQLKQKIDDACNLFEENRIDILVNSGGAHHTQTFFDVTEDEYDKIMNVNVKGTYFISRYVSEHMIEKNIKGHILNLASSSSLRPAWGPYHLSKWSVRAMTLGFAEKLQPYGIIVNAIAPGQTATPMLAKGDNITDIDNEYSLQGRYILPCEIANLAVILLSDIGGMVVGDTLYATGGSGILSLQR